VTVIIVMNAKVPGQIAPTFKKNNDSYNLLLLLLLLLVLTTTF